MEGTSTRHLPKCDSGCKDKPPARFKSQLAAYKLTQTACDLCLDGVHFSRQYCQTCRATYCSSHLKKHSQAPATRRHSVFTYAQTAAGSMVSWPRALMIMVAVVAVMIPILYMTSDEDEDSRVRAFVREQRAQADKHMQGCEDLYQAVENERIKLVQKVCHNQQMFRNRRQAIKKHAQEDHERLKEFLAENEGPEHLREFILPLLDTQRNFLYSILDNQTSSAGVQKWCDELAKSNAAQSS